MQDNNPTLNLLSESGGTKPSPDRSLGCKINTALSLGFVGYMPEITGFI